MKKYLPFIIVGAALVIGGLYLEFSSNGSIADLLPTNQDNGSETELAPKGLAPEFTGITNWLNSEPLTMETLRGKVVLVDFWTYSCINCIRTLSYVTDWHEKYSDQGLVIVGVHTPEFAFEKVTSNVETALARHRIKYPIAQDNDFLTWRAYNNRYWPAKYLVNQEGQIVYTHFGEGKYEETENAIRKLLDIDSASVEVFENTRGDVRTPEIYFGLSRLEAFSGSPNPSSVTQTYSAPQALLPNRFALSGSWRFADEFVESANNSAGTITHSFYADKIFMVAEAGAEVVVEVYLDGLPHNQVLVKDSQLYPLVDGAGYGPHTLELRVRGSGFRVFTFTFG